MTLAFNALRLLVPLTFALAACDNEGDNANTPLTDELADAGGKIIATTEIVVAPHERGCAGEEETYHLCKRVSAVDPNDDRDYEYGHIYGFDHEWGHRVTLAINVVEMPEEYLYGDGARFNYEVVEIVDDQLDIDEEFELPTFVFDIEPGASAGTLIDQTPVTCAPEVCDAIAAIPDNPISPMVRVRFGDEQPFPLVAVELLEGG